MLTGCDIRAVRPQKHCALQWQPRELAGVFTIQLLTGIPYCQNGDSTCWNSQQLSCVLASLEHIFLTVIFLSLSPDSWLKYVFTPSYLYTLKELLFFVFYLAQVMFHTYVSSLRACWRKKSRGGYWLWMQVKLRSRLDSACCKTGKSHWTCSVPQCSQCVYHAYLIYNKWKDARKNAQPMRAQKLKSRLTIFCEKLSFLSSENNLEYWLTSRQQHLNQTTH